MLGHWSCLTGLPARTVSKADRKSRPVTGLYTGVCCHLADPGIPNAGWYQKGKSLVYRDTLFD